MSYIDKLLSNGNRGQRTHWYEALHGDLVGPLAALPAQSEKRQVSRSSSMYTYSLFWLQYLFCFQATSDDYIVRVHSAKKNPSLSKYVHTQPKSINTRREAFGKKANPQLTAVRQERGFFHWPQRSRSARARAPRCSLMNVSHHT